MKLIAILIIITTCQTLFCQTREDTLSKILSVPVSVTSIDTENIYLSESSVPLRRLKKRWFPVNGSYSLSIVSRQDVVIANDSSYYFKVYDRHKKLVLEGKKGTDQQMTGLVKFYYSNGSIERTEFYRADAEIPDSTRIFSSDGTTPWGTWTFYNKKGLVTKTILYSAERSMDNKEICEIITTILFNRDNMVKSRQRKKKECREISS